MEIPYRPEWRTIVVEHIRSQVERSGASGAIVGVSGGLDSALVLALAVEAVGNERVVAVHLPSETTPPEDEKQAEELAGQYGVEYARIPIGESCGVVLKTGGEYGGLADANVHSRIRMVFLYYLANANNLLVLGTGNKTEILVGYFTKYGDGASDMLPIGDLYKTQVRQMAGEMKVPSVIIDKTPTAGLPGVGADEEEIGYSYETLDKVLWGMEHGWDDARIAQESKVGDDDVKKIASRVARNAHKRGLGNIPKIGLKTVGIDWREDKSW